MKSAGFGLGLLTAGVALAGWRIPEGSGSLGTDLTVLALRSGELDVDPAGLVLAGTGMRPGPDAAGAHGRLRIRNQTGTRLAVRLRALPSSGDLDQMLALRISSRGTELYRGTLGGLRRWTRRPLGLAPGGERTLDLRAWLPASVGDGYRGRIEAVTLELRGARPRSGG